MLRLLPLNVVAVPRVHVEPRRPSGTLSVLDRPTGQWLTLYTPRLTQQFQDGHRAGRWYVCPANSTSTKPRSPGFATKHAAVAAVASGRWSLDMPLTDRSRSRVRVFWTKTNTAGASRRA